MKISSASKKVLASALSAAMVVAFAPTVALAAVVQEDGGNSAEQAPAVSSDTVATVSWQALKGGTKYTLTQEFKATDEASYDNAVQSALAFAASPETPKGYTSVASKNTVVKLQKDVSVDAPSGVVFAHDAVTGEWVAGDSANNNQAVADAEYYQKNDDGTYTKATVKVDDNVSKLYKVVRHSVVDPDVEVAGPLEAAGEFTVDLNGHKLTNTANTAADKDTKVVAGEDGVLAIKDYNTMAGVQKEADKAVAGAKVYIQAKSVTGNTAAEKKTAAKAAIVSALQTELSQGVEFTVEDTFTQDEGTFDQSGLGYVKADGTTGGYYCFTVDYTVKGQLKDQIAPKSGEVTLTDSAKAGSIASVNADTVTAGIGYSVVLGDVAISAATAEGVKAPGIDAVDAAGTVTVKGTASVSAKGTTDPAATGKTDSRIVSGLKGGTVKVAKGAALTATAEAAEAGNNGMSAAIEAASYSADKAAAVDASAKAAGAGAASGSTGSTVNPDTGLIEDNSNGGSGAAKNVHSFAVKATSVDINAGKYSAEYAVADGSNVGSYTANTAGKGQASNETLTAKSNTKDLKSATGSIKYGEFEGHVFGSVLASEDATAAAKDTIAVTGGVFSESPANTLTEVTEIADGKAADKATKVYIGNYVDSDHAVATDGSKYYVYKSISVAGAQWTDAANNAWPAMKNATEGLIKVSEVAKPAKGAAVADWAKNTVASLATGKAVSGVELTGTDAAAVQKALIDGNVAVEDGKVSLQVTPKRVDPKSSKLTDAEKQLLSDIDKVADEQTQSVQSVFTISAQLNQGTDAKTGKAVKIADVKDMGDTKVNVTVRPVTANTEAQVAYTGGKTAALTMQQAVTNNQNVEASFETSSLDSFGILYSSAADAVKKQDKAAAKVVTDEIAKIAADYAAVDAKNYEAALAAVAEAEKDYSKLTDAQKKYVSEEQLASIATVKAAAEKVKAEQPAAKKANTVKVSKSKLTVKAGKKGTFKVSKAQGKVTVKSSSAKKAKASIKSGKVTVKGLKKGTATIFVKAAGNDAYKAKTVKVKVTVK